MLRARVPPTLAARSRSKRDTYMRAILTARGVMCAATLCLASLSAAAANLPSAGASAAQVQATMGAPTAVRSTVAGQELWEYAEKPFPYETYILVFSKGGNLKTIHQVINDKTFARIKPGITQESVRKLLGTPWRTTYLADDADDEDADILEYRGHDARGTYKFHIEFGADDRAVVIAKVRDVLSESGPAKATAAFLPKP